MTGLGQSRREQLTLAAVELLENSGPDEMTARKITARVGTSSMSVYTDFGSMGGLVAAVVDHGFGLLRDDMEAVGVTSDSLADLWRGVVAVRQFALAHPHLFRVMFAAEALGGYQRSGDELEQGVETLAILNRWCKRIIADGVVRTLEVGDVTRYIWGVMHGHIMLEMAGYLDHGERRFAFAMQTAFIGIGAHIDAATAAVAPS